ncbi:Pleckstrin homology domain [Trypanosoma melophagium]|uniref:Pleckstrin homology domain n=1 Tax=Trypanosoma melophagium TaxID=715481 RepID=UPI00351A7A0B|nr:Pleckstrin homology domain [Trypanosoma melophagium]
MSNVSHPSRRRVLAPPVLNPYEVVKEEEEERKDNNYNNYHSYNQYEHPERSKEHSQSAWEHSNTIPSSYPSHYKNQSGVYRELNDPNSNNDAVGIPHDTLPPPLPPPTVRLVSARTSFSDIVIQETSPQQQEETNKQQQQQQQQQQKRPIVLNTSEGNRKPQPPRRVPREATTANQSKAQPRAPDSRGPNSTTVVIHTEADQVSTSTRTSDANFSSRETQLPHDRHPAKQLYQSGSSYYSTISNRNSKRNEMPYKSVTRDRSSGIINNNVVPSQGHAPQEEKQEQRRRQQNFVIQSAFTQQNPFRRQTFEEFCCSPEYSAPSTFSTYKADLNGWSGFQRVSDGEFGKGQSKEVFIQMNPARSTAYPIPPAFLRLLQSGDWFLKWTRRGKVHKRFVWLDIRQDLIVWGPSPRSSYVFLSHLKLNEIVDVRPDCLFDESTQRTFYRLTFLREECTTVFATEMRDKFDFWFNALGNIISTMGSSARWSKLWGSPESQAAARTTNVSDWRASSSPLHAVLHGYEKSLHSAAGGAILSNTRGQVLPSD